MAKIESYRDYFNPANLAVLRKCNIKYQKAKECWNKEDWKKAIKLYNEFIEINTADASTFIEIGVAYYETKRMRLSQQNLERAKKLKPSNALLNYYLANIYSEKKSRLINKKYKKLKVLGPGDLKDKLTVEVNSISKSAKEKIEKLGGKVTLIK